jgi:hypothetical protein
MEVIAMISMKSLFLSKQKYSRVSILIRKLKWSSFLLCCTFLPILQCINHAGSTEEQTKPSFTVFPVSLAGNLNTDVAEVIGTFLERGGVTQIDIAQFKEKAIHSNKWPQNKESFCQYVKSNEINTQYALYIEFIGSPQKGIQEIRMIAVDNKGSTAWEEIQTPNDTEFKKVQPRNPMTCCVLAMNCIKPQFNLDDPYRQDAPQGKMAQRWKEKSGIPSKAELQNIKNRLQQLKQDDSVKTISVFPAISNRTISDELNRHLSDLITENPQCTGITVNKKLPIQLQPSSNQQKQLWDLARAFQQYIQENPPKTDYAICTHYLLSQTNEPARGINFIVCNNKGEWIIIDFQNEYQKDFQAINPSTLTQCNELVTKRFRDSSSIKN